MFSFNQTVKVLMDSESPNIPLVASAGPLEKPIPDQPALKLSRSSLLPQAGLWSVQATVTSAATLTQKMLTPENIGQFDTVTVYARVVPAAGVNTHVRARVVITDVNHARYLGDWYPVFGQWQPVSVDVRSMEESGLAVDSVTSVALELAASEEAPVDVFTDSWQLTTHYRPYLGQRLGISNSFYVQGNGGRLSIGVVDRFEVTIHKRGTDKDAPVRPWLEVHQGAKSKWVLGQEGTGLMLLDPEQRDRLVGKAHGDSADEATTRPDGGTEGLSPWPAGPSTYEWTVAWTSPIAALVEVKQVSGPYDRLGRPAVTALWRLMIYQTGEMFVSAAWQSGEKGTEPAAVALALAHTAMAANPEPSKAFLRDLYPKGTDQQVLPHDMQAGSPVAMIAKTAAARESYWEASTASLHVFGVDLPRGQPGGPVNCVLLVNSPTQLDQVSAFSSYMAPAAAIMKTGTLDTTFPGDFDNDSLVETYGFQTIRLTDGRAWFTLDPQNRPIYYPALLLTIPSAERDHMDLNKFNLLVNVDGQQVSHPPRWPDGSFLVQLPYIVSKPVRIEATLTPK